MQEVVGSTPIFSTKVLLYSRTFFIYAMFYVYIIYSLELNRYYVGYTSDVIKRLAEHNTGISTFTAKAGDWELRFLFTSLVVQYILVVLSFRLAEHQYSRRPS